VGYPAGEKQRRPRKSLEEVVMYEKWQG